MTLITKQFSFEAAHILSLPYDSKCRQLHGHSYTATVEIESSALDSNGMVMDYTGIPDISAMLDHKLLVPASRISPIAGTGMVRVTYTGDSQLFDATMLADHVVSLGDVPNSTAECIAQFIYDSISSQVPDGVTVKKVTVKETIKTSSTVEAA